MHSALVLNATFAGKLIHAASLLETQIQDNCKISRRKLDAAMATAFKCRSATGVWAQRDTFQMLEMVTLLYLSQLRLPCSIEPALAQLSELQSRLPTQTVRSEEQVEHQHFSTPLGLACLAARLADIQSEDVVLEPSAGTGMLAIWARHGASLHLNEIDPLREEILRYLFSGSTVTGHDAASVGAYVTLRPSVVLMNPPFARNAAGLTDPTTVARHLAAALAVLKPDGRLVAIMPGSFRLHGRRAELFQRALQGASVAFHARLEGAFAKQGTSIVALFPKASRKA